MYNFAEAGSQYIHKINDANFDDIALQLFRYQYERNEVYRSYVDAIGTDPADVCQLADIPFLPIAFFKTHRVVSVSGEPSLMFESSGTTGSINSRHLVFREELYEASLLRSFRAVYGDPSDYAILALLPSYLERKNASLVHMVRVLMRESRHSANGFYLDEWKQLSDLLYALERDQMPTLLIGVTFALLDFAEAYPGKLEHTIVMETGGMKGRKTEWTRQQVHDFLKQQWQLKQVHSEYGMTELLSQAYAVSDGIFRPAATTKVLMRELNDPLDVQPYGSGCLNVIDLANVDSCAFIATEDVGVVNKDGTFEVLGRMDHAALRGCSLMSV